MGWLLCSGSTRNRESSEAELPLPRCELGGHGRVHKGKIPWSVISTTFANLPCFLPVHVPPDPSRRELLKSSSSSLTEAFLEPGPGE